MTTEPQPNPLPVSVAEDHGAARVQSGGQRQDGWRPIESAPKDGTCVLAWIAHEADDFCDHSFQRASIISWAKAVAGPYGHVAGWDKQWIGEPTHWMPLPAPPSTAEQTASERSRDTDKPLTITHEMDESGEVREIKG